MNRQKLTQSYLCQRAGFGLLEVIFSTAIFIVVVGSLVSLSRLSLRNAVLSTHRSQAFNLAQDGLEIVRQMRDTTWIQGSSASRSLPGKSWVTYPGCTGTNYLASGVVFDSVNYALCYNTAFNPAQFGVKSVTNGQSCVGETADKDLCLTLRSGSGPNDPLDPGAPLFYRRVVRFESLTPSSGLQNEGICPVSDGGVVTPLIQGLQILNLDQSGRICITSLPEKGRFMRVKVTVSWQEFNKDWDVSLSSLLTDWRTN